MRCKIRGCPGRLLTDNIIEVVIYASKHIHPVINTNIIKLQINDEVNKSIANTTELFDKILSNFIVKLDADDYCHPSIINTIRDGFVKKQNIILQEIPQMRRMKKNENF
jgi:hypothetical protein